MRISVNYCALWNQPYTHLIEMDILLSDSLEMDLVIENLMVNLQCKFMCLGMVVSLLKDAEVEITFRAPYLALPFLPRIPYILWSWEPLLK